MDKNSVFNQSFVTVVQDKLTEVCVNGQAITRSKLCEALELDSTFEPCLVALIELNLIPGYDLRKGRGIGKTGESSQKKITSSTSGTQPVLKDNFVALLRSTLESIVPTDGKTCVSREDIATAMGDTSLKNQNMISAAIKQDSFKNEFSSRAGRNGGIYRVIAPAVEVEIEEAVEDELEDELEDENLDDDNIPLSASYLNPDGPLAKLHASKRQQSLLEEAVSSDFEIDHFEREMDLFAASEFKALDF